MTCQPAISHIKVKLSDAAASLLILDDEPKELVEVIRRMGPAGRTYCEYAIRIDRARFLAELALDRANGEGWDQERGARAIARRAAKRLFDAISAAI